MLKLAVPIMVGRRHFTIGNFTAHGRRVLKMLKMGQCLFTKVDVIFTMSMSIFHYCPSLGDAYHVVPTSQNDRRLDMSGL